MKTIQKEFNKKSIKYCKCPTCGKFYIDDVSFVYGSLVCPNCGSCVLRGYTFWERFTNWGLFPNNIIEKQHKTLISEIEEFTGFKAVFTGSKIEWIAGNIPLTIAKVVLLKALNDTSGKGFDLVVK